jgi:hypothetical protein
MTHLLVNRSSGIMRMHSAYMRLYVYICATTCLYYNVSYIFLKLIFALIYFH